MHLEFIIKAALPPILLILPLFLPPSHGQNIRIDHVISVVRDLDKATAEHIAMGFTLKPGRLHQNGLLNAHIKFRNGTSYELMSVQGNAKDKMARTYLQLMQEKEGGVYIALTGMATKEMDSLLSKAGIEHKVILGKAWNYITFPPTSGLAHFFFIENHLKMKDEEKYLEHKNGAIAMDRVGVEGNDEVLKFLTTLGLNITADTGAVEKMRTFSTSTGDIVVVPIERRGKRPRIKRLSFRKPGKRGELQFEWD